MRRLHPDRCRGIARAAVIAVLAGLLAANEAVAQLDLLQELRTVRRVRIEGARRVSTRELRNVLKTRSPAPWPWADRAPLRSDFLRGDTTSIRLLYRHHGHLAAHATYRLQPAGDDEMDVVFTVEEGPATRIESVDLLGVRGELVSAIRKRLWSKVGRPFDPAFLHLDTLIISQVHQDHGYLPRTRASSREIRPQSVVIQYEVAEGPVYFVRDITIRGRDQVAERLVTRELLLQPGHVYSRLRVERSQERLYQTGLFRQVQISTGFDTAQARVDFDLRVAERRRRWVDAGVGYATSEPFRLEAEWGARNLLGRGLENALSGHLSFTALEGKVPFQRARLQYSLLEPWLFGTRLRGEVTPYVELYDDRANPGYVLQQRFLGLDLRLTREINRFTRLSIVQRNQWVEQDVDRDASAIADSLPLSPNYQTHRLQLQGLRDYRDHPLFPSRGSLQSVTLEIAGGLLSGSSSFWKGEAIPAWYTPVGRNAVLATRLRAGILEPLGGRRTILGSGDADVARVPLEDRFRAGGVNSVRGFDENSIQSDGGLAVIEAGAELRVSLTRIPVLGPLGLEMFVDAGNVWTQPDRVRWNQFAPRVSREPLGIDDLRWVFGLGPRLESPLGPIRVDLSWNLRPVDPTIPARRDERGYLEPRFQFAVGPSF
ncbi:MAG: BamA/TamA family outer membrane protein [Candidatus Eisenbacteria bacterium]|uniref:BamA/TamA family outer membrane protein n=1 Tax=Eiseniibacteriota bacterium TaxID=2212470 RepID=A0A849SPU6_UNCEI|nr:BamA/TamA family outer membrane protein [Candidatus Eisenbacteria bacterium]